jgi:hypothetical protein
MDVAPRPPGIGPTPTSRCHSLDEAWAILSNLCNRGMVAGDGPMARRAERVAGAITFDLTGLSSAIALAKVACARNGTLRMNCGVNSRSQATFSAVAEVFLRAAHRSAIGSRPDLLPRTGVVPSQRLLVGTTALLSRERSANLRRRPWCG